MRLKKIRKTENRIRWRLGVHLTGWILAAALLAGCSGVYPGGEGPAESAVTETDPDSGDDSPGTEASAGTGDSGSAKLAWTFSLAEIPAYSGDPYVELNGNEPCFSGEDFTEEVFEDYSPLDRLGRCGTAFANVCTETMPEEPRGEIGEIRPSGWHTVKYPDRIEDNYLYNRCHLIGYQLCGENANERNLITGTRYLNKSGMLPFENQVSAYVTATGNHVLYRVTPRFDGKDLVASGVEMEAASVEDGGRGLSFHVYVYNVQPGVLIDYATGESREDPDYVVRGNFPGSGDENDGSTQAGTEDGKGTNPGEETGSSTGEDETGETGIYNEGDDAGKTGNRTGDNGADGTGIRTEDGENGAVPDEVTYVGNANSKKFHLPGCDSVKDMADHNKVYFTGSREEVLEAGFDPCKRCNP